MRSPVLNRSLHYWLSTETNIFPVFSPSFQIGKWGSFILLSCFVIAWSHIRMFELRVLAFSWLVFWTSIDRSGTCASHYVMAWADLCRKGFRKEVKQNGAFCMFVSLIAGSNSDPLVSVLKFIVPQCFLYLFWNSDWKMGLLHLAKLFRVCLIS